MRRISGGGGATPQRFKLLNSQTIEEKLIGIGSQPMQSRCMIDDDVISGAGNGAKFILVHGGGCCTLVSKCFPAYRCAPHTVSNVAPLNPVAATTPIFSRGLASTLRWSSDAAAPMHSPS